MAQTFLFAVSYLIPFLLHLNFQFFLFPQTEPDVLEFYKARINFFYAGNADKIDFDNFDAEVKGKVDPLISEATSGKVESFLQQNHFHVSKPMVALAANYFEVNKK